MSELSKLKKENKQLKALLRQAVELLNKYKPVLKQAEALEVDSKDDGGRKKDKREKKKSKAKKSGS
jgi:hypothetical protein